MLLHHRRVRPAPGRRLLPVVGLVLAMALSACASGGDGEADPGPRSGSALVPDEPPTLSVPEDEAAAGDDDRPNIVMVMTDDMRVDELRFAPYLTRLMDREGLRFENSFSNFPLCCPARASFLTGQLARNHEIWYHKKPYGYAAFDDSRTLATSLADAGYHTGFIGKYLNGYGNDTAKVSGKPSWQHVPDGWTDWVGAFDNPGKHGIKGGTYYYRNTPYNLNGLVDNSHKGKYQTNVIGDFSVQMARNYAQAASPFFMYVSYVAPHKGKPHEDDDPKPFKLNGKTIDSLKTPSVPEWVQGRFDDVITRPGGLRVAGQDRVADKPQVLRKFPRLTPEARAGLLEVTRQRAESIYVVDRNVKRLVRELKRSGEWDDTVLMFTSDNGYFLGEHRKPTGKILSHEPSLRVPFLVAGPGLRSGERSYDPISTVDVTATILDLADAEPPHEPDGHSLLPTMRRGDRGWSTYVHTEATHTSKSKRDDRAFDAEEVRTSIGLRTPRWSFSRYRGGEGELYDLVEDPTQQRNLFGRPAYADVQRRLTRAWEELKDCAGEQCLVPMDPQLQAGPAEARTMGSGYWAEVRRAYGW